MNRSRIYLDYAATTPVDPLVFRAMKPYFSEKFGNAGSLHSFGQEAIAALDRSRETVARAVGVGFRDVLFTSSATEANNLVLRGMVCGERHTGKKSKIIISSIEHESVLETAKELERDGVEVVFLPVNRRSIVDVKILKKSLTENTVLVSIMYANNEIGVIQPIREISEIIKDFKGASPLFHTDASQAFQYLDCDMSSLGVDFMTLSSHKIYGPKGAAALVKKTTRIAPVTTGGGQEFGLRSGTENIPAIVGFAKAVEVAMSVREKESKRISALREYFWRGIKKIHPKTEINGFDPISSAQCPVPSIPHILNIYFPGHDTQDILTQLDLAGIAASSGSACRSRAMESSYVMTALGYANDRAKSSIRFSFGRQTTKGELDVTLKVLKAIVNP